LANIDESDSDYALDDEQEEEAKHNIEQEQKQIQEDMRRYRLKKEYENQLELDKCWNEFDQNDRLYDVPKDFEGCFDTAPFPIQQLYNLKIRRDRYKRALNFGIMDSKNITKVE
jgi:hypothetical protein